jgi:Bacterial Ig-like domain (group 3)
MALRATLLAVALSWFGGMIHAQTATTTTLTSVTPAAPQFGQTVTLTAQVVPIAAPGMVSFMDGGVLVGVGTVNASGIAQATTLTLSAGQHFLVAYFFSPACQLTTTVMGTEAVVSPTALMRKR